MNVSEFNRRGTMTAYDYDQRDSGGTYRVFRESIDIWCKIENLSVSTNPTQAQMKTDASYKITARYNPVFTTNWVFSYEGIDMMIKDISVDNEGYKRFMIFYCSTTIKQESWS